MVVARAITQDGNGLSDIEGIHQSVWTGSLPLREDLQIYTRWGGAGTHEITVTILTPDGSQTIGRTSDELDFGKEAVTFYTHDFYGTTFTRSGAYPIAVALDGEIVATYAYFVNIPDTFLATPAFVLSVPAQDISTQDDGEVTIKSVFEYFSFPRFPASDSFVLATVWFSGDGKHAPTVSILDPDGTVIATSAAMPLAASFGALSVEKDFFNDVSFAAPGTYRAIISLDGAAVFSAPLVILAQ